MEWKWFFICFLSAFVLRRTTGEDLVIEVYQEVNNVPRDSQEDTNAPQSEEEKEEEELPRDCTVGVDVYGNGDQWRDACNVYVCADGTPTFSRTHESCCQEGPNLFENGDQWTLDCYVYDCINGTGTINRTHESCCTVGVDVFGNGDQWTIGCFVYDCINGTETFNRTHESCCQEGPNLFENGDQWTLDCYVYDCINGTGTINRTHESCCTAGVVLYQDGNVWSDQCAFYICLNGTTDFTLINQSCCWTPGGIFVAGELFSYGCHNWNCSNGQAAMIGYLEAVPGNMDNVSGEFYLPRTISSDRHSADNNCSDDGFVLAQPPSDLSAFVAFLQGQNAGNKWWIGGSPRNNQYFYDRDGTEIPASMWKTNEPSFIGSSYAYLDSNTSKLATRRYNYEYPFVCQCLHQNVNISF